MVTSSTNGRCRSSSARSVAGAHGEVGDRAHARVVAAVGAAPHRDRRAPEPVARQRPVDVVGEPVAEPAVADVLGVPADRLVLAEQLVLVLGGAREPRGLRPVDERGAAPPAVRDRSARTARRPRGRRACAARRSSAGSASFTNRPATDGHRRLEARLRVHRVEHRQALGLADLAVDLAERRREVHDPGAVVGGHEVGGDDAPAVALGGQPVEGPLVPQADEVARRDRTDDVTSSPRTAATRSAPSTRSRPPSGSRTRT